MPRRITQSQKREIITQIFDELKNETPNSNVLPFDNDRVKDVSRKKFSNQFDATKFDSESLLPEKLRKEGYFILHLGKGKHAFVKGKGYHTFEPIKIKIPWKATPSIIAKLGESEASTSSELFNSKIIHNFLELDKNDYLNLQVHTGRRTRVSYDFIVDPDIKLEADKLQIETDAFFETLDELITVEVKNVEHEDFEIRQLFSAMKYMEQKVEEQIIPIKYKIRHLFVVRFKKDNRCFFHIYEYKFKDNKRLNSIELIKNTEYVIDI